LLLQHKSVNAFAEPQLESGTVEALLREYIKRIPQSASPMGICVEAGKANAEDLARVAEERLFVQIKLN
jgi:hypothetical protein